MFTIIANIFNYSYKIFWGPNIHSMNHLKNKTKKLASSGQKGTNFPFHLSSVTINNLFPIVNSIYTFLKVDTFYIYRLHIIEVFSCQNTKKA